MAGSQPPFSQLKGPFHNWVTPHRRGTAVDPGLVGATQEALANVAKHAGVQQAVVRVASTDGGVEVTVRDHGRGFDLDRPVGGFGIAESIVGRMRDVGGRATVWSAPDRGTRVIVWGPQ